MMRRRMPAYIAQFNPYAAAAMSAACSRPGTVWPPYPRRGWARPDGHRELAVIHPYVLVYEAAGEEIRVLRIWHGAQERD